MYTPKTTEPSGKKKERKKNEKIVYCSARCSVATYSAMPEGTLLPWQADSKRSEKNTYVVDQRLEKNVALRCIPAWTLKIASDRFKAVTQACKEKEVCVYVCAIA
jgi:hypothetical protein